MFIISGSNIKLSSGYFLRTLIASTVTIFFTQICLGQGNMRALNQEGFVKLTDEVMKREILSFTLRGVALTEADSLYRMKLEKVPLKKCSDKFVYFEKGDIYNSEIIVNIETDTKDSIAVIRLLYGRYGQFLLPDSAITGVYNPKFCEQYAKKGKPIKSNCRVFRSEDKRRIYIYMVNGDGRNRYEVTWVVQDSKYYTRVIDPI